MKTVSLVLFALLQHQVSYCQKNDSLSLNNILAILNEGEFSFIVNNASNLDPVIEGENGSYRTIKLFSTNSMVVYYKLNESLFTSLEPGESLSTGFELIVYSNKVFKGIQFFFTNSHSMRIIDENEFALKFNVSQDLCIPKVNLLDSRFHLIGKGSISWIHKSLPKNLSPVTTVDISYLDNSTHIEKIIKVNYFDMLLDDLFDIVDEKI